MADAYQILLYYRYVEIADPVPTRPELELHAASRERHLNAAFHAENHNISSSFAIALQSVQSISKNSKNC